jgi:hypothetical protein
MPDFEAFLHPKNEATYPAICHCCKSRFTVPMPSLDTASDTASVMSCNCSICEINGYLNVYLLRKNVIFQSSYDDLGSCVFGNQTRVQKFRKTCGTSLLTDFEKAEYDPVQSLLAVNVCSISWVPLVIEKLTPST